MKLSTDKIISASVKLAEDFGNYPKDYRRHLDVGAGGGEMIALLQKRFPRIKSHACDYTESLMALDEIGVDVVDLNTQALPYECNTFDIVTCTEVLEHVEHYRETIREIYRVLEGGGIFVLSTPNILNIKSRIRFLITGFYNLFGPLHFRESDLHTTGGHINPVSVFYLVHALKDAGFDDVELRIDKKQGSSLFGLIFLYVPIKIMAAISNRKESRKYRTIDEFNRRYVDMINCFDVLVGRTIVIGCRKPV